MQEHHKLLEVRVYNFLLFFFGCAQRERRPQQINGSGSGSASGYTVSARSLNNFFLH